MPFLHLCLKCGMHFLGWMELVHILFHMIHTLFHSLCIVFKSDKEKRDLQMAECDPCQAWHHRKCVKMPVSVFRKRVNVGFAISINQIASQSSHSRSTHTTLVDKCQFITAYP